MAADPGPAVDASGRPVVDPTANVLQLVEAAIKRQDDLREAADRHVHQIAELRARYDEKLRLAETARIDAIRAVDVGAVNRAAEVSTQQASTLAVQVAQSAEALRTQVAAAATAATVALAAALEPIQKDIQDLRKTQYEQAGGRSIAAESKVDSRSGSQDIRSTVAIIIAAVSTIAAVVLGVIAATR
jgi:hypothetical protein